MYTKLEKPEFLKQKELYLQMEKSTLAEILAMRDVLDYESQNDSNTHTYTITSDDEYTSTTGTDNKDKETLSDNIQGTSSPIVWRCLANCKCSRAYHNGCADCPWYYPNNFNFPLVYY